MACSATAAAGLEAQRCAAYVISDCDVRPPEPVLASGVQRRLDGGDVGARRRVFMCTHGSRIFFVKRSCNGCRPHFRHQSRSGGGSSGDGGVSSDCPCSDEHVQAQALIKADVGRLCVRTWRDCGKHASSQWSAPAGARVVMEKSARLGKRWVRYDLAVYNGDHLVKVIEIKRSHATDPADRPHGTIELCADEVVRLYTRSESGRVAIDNLMRVKEHCEECRLQETERQATAREEARLAAERQAIAREEARLAAERQRKRDAERQLKEEAERQRQAEAERLRREALAREAAIRQRWQQRLRTEENARAESAAREAEAERQRRLRIEELYRDRDESERKRERKRQAVAEQMQVDTKPGFRVVIGTAPPAMSQADIERLRAERIERQKAQRNSKSSKKTR